MKKILKSIICTGLISALTTACVTVEEKNKIEENKPYTSIVESKEYTEMDIYQTKIRYKLAESTSLWDCDYNFGALEIDTILMPSKNGQPIDKYYDIENISGIHFQTGDDAIKSEDSLKFKYKNWYNIYNLKVENIEKGPFVKYIKGETKEIYMESYALKYKDENGKDTYYDITLVLYKNDYDKELINKVIDEYHLIINTLELI